MPQLEQIATFPSQLFWLVCSFMILFLVIWRLAVPKITDALETRQKRIEDNLERAAEIKREASATLESYQTLLTAAQSDAQMLIAETVAKLKETTAIREAECSENIQARISESEVRIAASVDSAAESIHAVAIEVVQSATEKLVGESPSADDANTALDSAIKAHD